MLIWVTMETSKQFRVEVPAYRNGITEVHLRFLGNPVEGERDSGVKPNTIPL
jgi:hypothetical protein